ncbi:hypothetical protein LCGC14_1257920 [marine sediment metagenome]|uniref:N-acetyltransferase domain-containing protein n=1 Tax=marine sediment metagenome TaxID=412755 RepID=A0A0F9L486_9ZZZZ|nr:N-acetyltransferase [Candidatus Aminicenantes bacterium]
MIIKKTSALGITEIDQLPLWLPLTSRDILDLVICLRKYPLSMDDTILKYPLQHYTLRLASQDTEYVKIHGIAYMALDPIGLHDATIHFIRDPASRAKKEFYLDTARKFVIHSLIKYNLPRITLTVVDGQHDALKISQQIGFKHEGTLRQYRVIDGIPRDIHILSVLRSEV